MSVTTSTSRFLPPTAMAMTASCGFKDLLCPHCDAMLPDGAQVNQHISCGVCRRVVFAHASPTAVIGEASVTPDICCVCGTETRRKQSVRSKRKEGYSHRATGGIRFAGDMFLEFLYLFIPFLKLARVVRHLQEEDDTHERTAKFVVRVPVCRMCISHSIKPLDVDFNYYEITLACCERFRDELRKQNN